MDYAFKVLSSRKTRKQQTETSKIHIHFNEETGIHQEREFDKRGNLLFYKESIGSKEYWEKYKYDENNCLVLYQDSLDVEVYKEYDKSSNCIHAVIKNGLEYWCDYKDDELIYYRDSNGLEFWRMLNENSLIIHYKDNQGKEEFLEYDSNNNIIHHKMIGTGKDETWSQYDSENKLIYERYSFGLEKWYKYNSEGELILTI